MVQLNISQDQEEDKERNSAVTTKSQKIDGNFTGK